MDLHALDGKKLILGVTGGIAAYKAALLVRLFKKASAEVQVLMTPDAARFITPLTLGTLSEREVLVEIFPENEDGSWTKHVGLGLWADLFVVAPATAQTIAKLAHGFSDSMLTATALAARCPLLVCPAMDHDMYVHPATRANLERLRGFGYHVLEPARGELASGLVGEGRLPEPEAIAAHVAALLDGGRLLGEGRAEGGAEEAGGPATDGRSLAGRHVLVTAGPTREAIDPVRFLSNHSTGTMGYAVAAEAARRGARVTLVAGPTHLPVPEGVEHVAVESADEMHAAAQQYAAADLVVAAAAVADYAPAAPSRSKLKKTDGDLTLRLRRTPDVLRSLGERKRPGQVLVGFALETDDGEANAWAKLRAKHLDLVVLNDPNEEGAGFGTGTNRVTLLFADGRTRPLGRMPKADLAGVLLDCAAGLQKSGDDSSVGA